MTLPAMIFAAGFGTRMGALTQDRPKPLLDLGGATLLDHALDLCRGAGCAPLVVNAHYQADQIVAHLAVATDVTVRVEAPEILETGGGLKAARADLGGPVAVTVNADVLFVGPNPVATALAAWDPTQMDALLLTISPDRARCHAGPGDFVRDDQGRPQRGPGEIFTGVHILSLDQLDGVEEGCFSLNRVWTQIADRGRLALTPYDGTWVDVGTPTGLQTARTLWAPHV